MSLNVPVLQPKLFLGLNTKIYGNIHYLSDEDVVYPVGSVISTHNFNVKKQKFIKLAEKGKNLTHILVSPNKKYIAVVEAHDDKLPVITLWCPHTYRKKKTLVLPTDQEIMTSKYVALDFTYDSSFIIGVTDKPDWCMYSFKCDKGRLESRTRALNPNNTGTITDISCNPNDVHQVVLVGDALIRLMACSEFNWRQYGYSKPEALLYTSCCWLAQDRVIVGSSKGKIVLLECGELKATFHANNLPVIDMKLIDEMEQASSASLKQVSSDILNPDENYEVRNFINFSRGFAFSYLNGQVHLYEKITPNKYIKRNTFFIPEETSKYEEKKETAKNLTEINCIAINPAQDRMLVTCGYTQIFAMRLWMQEFSQEQIFSKYGYSLHNGPIGSMAVCRWKPWVLTAGLQDRHLKLWNYESEELELEHKFEDELYGITLHPTGLYCVIGFTDKLRYMMVMIDEFITSWEFSIRACKMVNFCNMGHMFAAANGNVIHIYSSITFDMMYVFKGHNGRIQGMSWSQDDNHMASCGSDGAVYEWKVYQALRISETIIKSNPINGVCMTSTAKGCYSIATDGHLRELLNSNIIRDVALVSKSAGLDAMCLSQLDTMLFVAGNKGVVYSVKLPLFEKAEMMEFIMHSTTISRMCLSLDDRVLVTAGIDGNICFWKLLNTEDKAAKLDNEFETTKEILISKKILEEKITTIKDLQMRLKELETEHAYQMRQSELSHEAKLKEVHQGYCSAIEELKEKNEQMESDHIQETQNTSVEVNKMKTDHEEMTQKLEANYNEKLINEYQKYQRLEDKLKNMRNNYEQELQVLKEAKIKSEMRITNDFLDQLKDRDVLRDEMKELAEKHIKEHELIKQQIEDDADREIYELKLSHEKKIRTEIDQNVRLRGEVAVVQKKLYSAQREAEDLKHNVASLENDHVKFKSAIINLEKDIADLKKEILERNSTIEEKEKRIFQLKSKNQELEKFKFLLDFKIKELNSQIEPRERTIQEQTKQINEMVTELENLQKVILSLDLNVVELKEKFNASDHEVKREIEKNRKLKTVLKTIRIDIHRASGFVHNIPMLTKTVKEMYHKYNADKDFMVTQAEDVEAKSEFLRQRCFLERTVSTLQQQAAKSTNLLSSDKGRLVEENAALLVETNHLRRYLTDEIKQNKKFESLLGFSGKSVIPRMVQQKVDLATATREEIHEKYRKTITENETCIAALKEDNERLSRKLAACEDILRREDELLHLDDEKI